MKKKKKNANYITKADLEAKRENETWDQYFENKKALKKFVYKNKTNQQTHNYDEI